MPNRRISRRSFVFGGTGLAMMAAAGAGYGLVESGALPGKAELDRLTGGCEASGSSVSDAAPGPTVSGEFFSRAGNTTVGWTISYPPGHDTRSRLPLALALHGLGGSHVDPLGPIPPSRLLAARVNGRRVPPYAIAAADGGPDYWHAHPGDDPMAMLTEEFLPMCRARGLGVGPHGLGVAGTSMGGYGALLFAEQRSDVAAVAAISPAVWTSYDEARSVNVTAFTSAADFAAHDVIAHAGRLRGTAVRIASGYDDPLHPGAVALARVLPAGATIVFASGCHDGAFFGAQSMPSALWLGQRLT